MTRPAGRLPRREPRKTSVSLLLGQLDGASGFPNPISCAVSRGIFPFLYFFFIETFQLMSKDKHGYSTVNTYVDQERHFILICRNSTV